MYGLYNIHITAVKDVKNELPCVINDKINLRQDEYAALRRYGQIWADLEGLACRKSFPIIKRFLT